MNMDNAPVIMHDSLDALHIPTVIDCSKIDPAIYSPAQIRQ